MAAELYDAAVLMDQVHSRIEAREKKISGTGCVTKDLSYLFELESNLVELLEKVFLLADADTKVKLLALQTYRNIGSRLEFKSKEVRAAQRIGNLEQSRETKSRLELRPTSGKQWREAKKSQVATTAGESKGRTEEVELQQARAYREIADKFKKMLLNVYKPVARSMEVPKRNFELGSISSLFDQLWDNTRQLQLVSTQAKLLTTAMLADNTLVNHASALQLCAEDIDRLCRWIPEFEERLLRIKKDDQMGKKLKEGAEMEEILFACHIRSWERLRRRNNSISFEDSTTLSSMLFTHCMPGHHPLFADVTGTMQIFSIKITGLEDFILPLEVYGVVAARDAVDYRRNMLFLRSRDDCQLLTEEDCFLHLTGPSRAIVSADTVHIEFQLKVKRNMKSEDISLITEAFACDADEDTSITIPGCFCKIELCCEYLKDSIQATIIGIRVMEGSLPFANGVQVICFSLPEESAEGKTERTTNHVVLFDHKDGPVRVDEEGYMDLSRQVVSVQVKGKLQVVTKTGAISGSVVFKPQLSNISQERCILGDCKLEITVAWSFVVDAEQDMLMMSYTKSLMVPSSLPLMKLVEDIEGGSC